jgi:acylphosphatase
MVRRVVIFQGRVQGVGFRATAADAARKHPVTGWVRNEPDFSVRLEVQGDPAAIDAVLADLRARMARSILGESGHEAPPDPEEVGFRIRR